MPSERGRLGRLLRSQGLGVVAGQVAALSLAVGSVVIAATRGGASADLRLDDLRPFLERPRLVHLWFWPFAGALALWGLNAALCTWDTVVARWRAGMRGLAPYAASLVHLSFLVALVAHLVGGLLGDTPPSLPVSAEAELGLPDGRRLRLEDLSVEVHPDGTPRAITATVRFREPDGRVHLEDIGLNRPYSRGFASELFLLDRIGPVPVAVWIERPGSVEVCRLAPFERCTIGGREVELLGFSGEPDRPVAELRVGGERVAVGPGGKLPGGAGRVTGVFRARRGAMLRHRIAPGHPLALLAGVIMLVGIAGMGRRWIPWPGPSRS